MRKYGLLGIPFGACARWPGCCRGPATLRAKGLFESLNALVEEGAEITDYGDTEQVSYSKDFGNPKLRHIDDIIRQAPQIIENICKIYQDDRIPVVIGGDHSISISTFSAAQQFHKSKGERLGLLWVDAHPDLCTPDTSMNGNIHGMSVAHLLGHGDPTLAALVGKAPQLEYTHVVFVGLRSVDPPEKIFINSKSIRAYTMKHLDQLGVATVVKHAIDHLKNVCDGLWLSFDLDVCDPDTTPGVGTPVRGGLTFREAHLIMEMVAESNFCRGIELVEYSPDYDNQSSTANVAIGLLESALGKTIL